MKGHYRSAIYLFSGMAVVTASFVLWSTNHFAAIGLAVLALALFLAAYGMRCPRCRLGVDSRERAGYEVGYVPSADCPKCGRSRRGVWPFQFLLRPERL